MKLTHILRFALCALLSVFLCVPQAFAGPDYRRQKNKATKLYFEIRNSSTGALISGATGLDCEFTPFADGTNPGATAFADFSGAEAEVASTGTYYVPATQGEMNSDYVLYQCKSSSTNAMTWTATVDTIHGNVLTNASGQLDADTIPPSALAADGTLASVVDSDTLRLASGEVPNDADLDSGRGIALISGTGLKQYRCIISSADTNDQVDVAPAFNTLPSGTVKYMLTYDAACGLARTKTLLAGSVTATSFSSGAIDSSAIAADAIGASELATDAIGSAEIAADAIGASEIASNAVGAAEVADGAIDSATFAAGAINAAALNSDVKGASYNSSTDTLEQIRDNEGVVTAINSGAIEAADVSSGAANKIADHTLRRQNANVEASSDGDALDFQSLYGAVAKQTNNISVAGSTLTIKKADGTTTFDTQTVSTTTGAAPVTGLSN